MLRKCINQYLRNKYLKNKDAKSKSSNLIMFHDIEGKKRADTRRYAAVGNLSVPETHAGWWNYIFTSKVFLFR